MKITLTAAMLFVAVAAGFALEGCGSSTKHKTGNTGATAGQGGQSGGGNAGTGGGNGCRGTGTSAIGAQCVAHADCCSGYCDLSVAKCATAPGACTASGQACTAGPDCCSSSCVGGKCSGTQCTADNAACTTGSQCCSGACGTTNTCTPLNPACKTSGNPCGTAGDCCSKFCVGGFCSSAPSFCRQDGDACTGDTQCCGGVCTRISGATNGICAVAPASGATGCLNAGAVCSGGAVYDGGTLPTCGGSCCSRACFPYAPTGVLICQPPSGCHPTGELCATDTDCCGSATLPDGTLSHVTCSKAPGATLGRCDNGQKCAPAGAICRLQTVSCNATDTCCAGNVQQTAVCKQDNLGIPRCLAATVNCANPQTYVGKACASSADCCNLPCVRNTAADAGAAPFVCAGACVQRGGACTTAADCCPGLPCTIAPGTSTGKCDYPAAPDGGVPPPPPPDAGKVCSAYGQACTVASDCCNGIPCTAGFCVQPVR